MMLDYLGLSPAMAVLWCRVVLTKTQFLLEGKGKVFEDNFCTTRDKKKKMVEKR